MTDSSCKNVSSLVYGTSYWTGVGMMDSTGRVFCVRSNGDFALVLSENVKNMGIKLVVKISLSEF